MSGQPAYMKAIGNYVFGITEALEFCAVFEAFHDQPSARIRPKLMRALSGPERLFDETPQNSEARNTMFELFLAADWKLNGLDVELGDPDVTLLVEGHSFSVECKRPYQPGRLYDNLRSARTQLRRKRLGPDPQAHGLIAVSVSRILNPGNLCFTTPSMNDKSLLGDRLEKVLHENEALIARLEPDPSFCGILFHASTPVDVGPGEHFALMHFYAFQQTGDLDACALLNRAVGSLYPEKV
ncbi:MAG: hypothetical protein WBC78_01270 [Candidatus Sulfotelmatobacter sp.]